MTDVAHAKKIIFDAILTAHQTDPDAPLKFADNPAALEQVATDLAADPDTQAQSCAFQAMADAMHHTTGDPDIATPQRPGAHETQVAIEVGKGDQDEHHSVVLRTRDGQHTTTHVAYFAPNDARAIAVIILQYADDAEKADAQVKA